MAELDDVGPRDTQEVSGLLGRDDATMRNHDHGVIVGNRPNHHPQRLEGGGGVLYGFLPRIRAAEKRRALVGIDVVDALPEHFEAGGLPRPSVRLSEDEGLTADAPPVRKSHLPR